MFFLLLGSINAAEVNNVSSTDDTNLMVDTLSSNNIEDSNLEVSSDDNILNSNNDNEQLQASGSDVKTNVTKTSTAITVQNAHYSKSNTIFKVVLQDKSGNLLSNKKISLKINGKTYTNTTQSNGAAYITLPSLNKGTYKITANFYGDSKYKSSTFSGNKMVISSISDRKNLVKTYGVEKYFTATFWKDNARLANTNVKITLNGKTYTVKTDSKGVGKINTDLLPGKYTIKLYNPYAKETVTNSITVNKDSSNITATNEYILPNSKYSYSITLKTGKGEPIKNAKIQFNYNNEKVTSLTNANGEATTTIPALSKGTYTISYTYYGNTKYNSVSGSKKLFVRDSTTTLKTRDLKMQYNDGSAFGATVTDSSGKALANKTIKFTMNGKTVKATTNNYGTAILDLSSLKPDTYNIKTTYSSAGSKDYNTQTNKITVNKQSVTIVTSDLVMKYNSGSSFQATIKDKADKALSGIIVKFTIKGGNTYNITTNSNGIAKLPISGNVGEYTIYTQIVEGTYYTSSKVTNKILINGTKFQASDMTISENTAGTFSVKLVDGQGKPVISTVKFTLNNKVQSVQTDANGIAKLPISGLAKGTYTVTYTSGSFSGSSKINVINKVTLKEVITASQNVKKYIEANNELPKTVTIGGNTYSTAEYVYLASQAIINLNSNSKADIAILGVKSPTSPKNAENLGNLYDYLSVAKSVVNTAKSKGIMPDSVSSNVGTIGYNGLVYATARVVAFYGDYSIMPNYVAIKTYSASSSSSSLNSKNTITNLKPYLSASTNCQVGNSKIKSIVNSLTSGLTTDVAKAKAIYNYVRDAVSYSFYYNTRYGAVGTLNAKTGNCVDQAHLLIAMYRTAGLAARYVHGTCVFSSGSTYGHVWAQVLIGDTWTVVDATSTRNSFGNVVNWNNYNYNLHGYYSSIAF